MIGYCLKNDEGKYLSMSGGTTDNWFEASKFDRSGIEARKMYLECGYTLFEFNITESETIKGLCGNYCDNKLTACIDNEGVSVICDKCNRKTILPRFNNR